MQCIGILGGTFNPIHYGHLRIALEVAEALPLNHVKFLPAARPPLKTAPKVTSQQRSEMVQLAIASNPLFSLDTRELERSGLSYTIDTLIALRAEHPHDALCLILGTDAFIQFEQWHCWQNILDYCHLIIVTRPSEGSWQLTEPLQHLLNQHQTHQYSTLSQSTHGLIATLEVTALAISSSQIRSLVHTDKRIDYLCPHEVINYIQSNRLYLD